MLQVYFLPQWFDLSYQTVEDVLYNVDSTRRSARVDSGDDPTPDESPILQFRHLLEQRALTTQSFDAVRAPHTERRLLLKAGTIVDGTMIAVPARRGTPARRAIPP